MLQRSGERYPSLGLPTPDLDPFDITLEQGLTIRDMIEMGTDDLGQHLAGDTVQSKAARRLRWIAEESARHSLAFLASPRPSPGHRGSHLIAFEQADIAEVDGEIGILQVGRRERGEHG